MLLATEPRNDLVMSENQLERLYLIQDLKEILESLKIQQAESISDQKLNTLFYFLESGKAHHEGQFISFPSLDTAEVYSLINKSLTIEQILNYTFKTNVDSLLQIIENINSIDEADKLVLTTFLSNLINNLSMQDPQSKRNFFDW